MEPKLGWWQLQNFVVLSPALAFTERKGNQVAARKGPSRERLLGLSGPEETEMGDNNPNPVPSCQGVALRRAGCGAWSVSQWSSACLGCVGAQVSSPALAALTALVPSGLSSAGHDHLYCLWQVRRQRAGEEAPSLDRRDQR